MFIIAIAFLIWTIICIRESIVEGRDKMNAISMLVALLGWGPVLLAGALGVIRAGEAISIYKVEKHTKMIQTGKIITEQKFKEICSKEFEVAAKKINSEEILGEAEREKKVLFAVCAEVLVEGTDFNEDFKKFKSNGGVFTRALFMVAAGLLLGAIAIIFLKEYWIWCLVGGVVLILLAGTRPLINQAKEIKEFDSNYFGAVRYARDTINSLQDEGDRTQALYALNKRRTEILEEERALRELVQAAQSLKSTLNRMHGTGYGSSGSSNGGSASGSNFKPTWNDGSNNPNARRGITDEAGRVQGYTENGRIYNNENDVVGHIEGNRVYDKDFNRVGEVGSDGKITKYK